MFKRIVSVISLLLLVGCSSVVVGTNTPTPTVQGPTNTQTATLTETATYTQVPTETATITIYLPPTLVLQPSPVATHDIAIFTPDQTNNVVEVIAPSVNIRLDACICGRRNQIGGTETETTTDDVYEQLHKGDTREVYLIYRDYTTGEIWARITPDDGGLPKWVSIEPKLCRDENSKLINCAILK